MIMTATLHFLLLPSFQDLQARLSSLEAHASAFTLPPQIALLTQQSLWSAIVLRCPSLFMSRNGGPGHQGEVTGIEPETEAATTNSQLWLSSGFYWHHLSNVPWN